LTFQVAIRIRSTVLLARGAATVPRMEALLWSDYLCPWCYVGQARSQVLRELGVAVTALPFELHPEIPAEGRRVRPDGRLGSTFERVEAECEAAGLPFRRPTRMPNTHRALATAEVIRIEWPTAFEALDKALFQAQFATGDALDDPDVLDALVEAAGAPSATVRNRVDNGVGSAAVARSMERARQVGVTGTPTWLIGELAIPGALPAETMRRWVQRLRERSEQAAPS